MKPQNFKIFLFIFLLSFFYYAYLFGIQTLNPTYTAWLWKAGISAQNYLGWAFFKNEAWHFPPGAIETFNLSQQTSIGLTDAIPLWAFLFKLFSPFLPNEFQYLGLFLFSNILLLGIVSYFWAKRLTENVYLQILFIAFLIISPPLLLRLHWNPALSAHWIILGALFSFLSAWRFKIWLFWALIASLIHPYILAMVMTIILFHLLFSKTPSFMLRFIHFLAIFFISFITLYLTGYFVSGGSLEDVGFGANQLNLIALFNGMIFKPSLLIYDFHFESDEGLLYLGLGMLFLLLPALFLYFKNRKNNPSFIFGEKTFPLWFCVGLLAIYALASPVRFLNTELFSIPFYDYPLFKQITGIFRATGRFGWPFFYVLNIFVLAVLFQYLKPKILIPLLSFALILQMVDLSPQYRFMREQNTTYLEPHLSEVWKTLARPGGDVIIFPSGKSFSFGKERSIHVSWENYIPPAFYIAYVAYKNKMRVNYAHSSRMNILKWQENMAYHLELLKKGKQAPNTLYVFFDDIPPKDLENILPAALFQKIQVVDGYPILPICENNCI